MLLYPRMGIGQDIIADVFGSPYYAEPIGTIPVIEEAEEIDTLDFDVTLEDGRFGEALDILGYFAERANGRILVERFPACGPLSAAGLVQGAAARRHLFARAGHVLLIVAVVVYFVARGAALSGVAACV